MSMPEVGDVAPEVALPDETGTIHRLADQRGRWTILYFYPKDDTPGCTAQACSLRDNFERVMDTGVEVFGVSPDSVKSHVAFRAKYDLPYRLLADPGHEVADRFDVWVTKEARGRTYMGIERSSFIIGPDGKVEHVLERVKPMEHVDLLLDALAA